MKRSKPHFLAIAMLGMLMPMGCTSIKSTQLYRSTEGKFSACCLPDAKRGVPCKFKVETGVRAEIYETIFIDPSSGQTVVPPERRIYSIQTVPVYSDQNFMVHIPRPCAGTLDLNGETKGYTFNEEGYLIGIGAAIEDKTIQDITTILGDSSLGGLIKKQSASVTGSSSTLELQNRLIAVREFSYGEPNWHIEFNSWINQFQQCEFQCNCSCEPPINFQNVPSTPIESVPIIGGYDGTRVK